MLLPLPRTADFAWANRSPSLNLLITHYKFNPSTPFIIRFINFTYPLAHPARARESFKYNHTNRLLGMSSMFLDVH